MKVNLAELRKALVVLAAVAGQLVTLGLLPEPYKGYVAAVLGVLAVAGVYAVPNAAPAEPE